MKMKTERIVIAVLLITIMLINVVVFYDAFDKEIDSVIVRNDIPVRTAIIFYSNNKYEIIVVKEIENVWYIKEMHTYAKIIDKDGKCYYVDVTRMLLINKE